MIRQRILRAVLVACVLTSLSTPFAGSPAAIAAPGDTTIVSAASDGTLGDASAGGSDGGPSVSADGRYVAFESWATNLVADDTNGTRDIFVHDRIAGTTARVSVASDGAQLEGDSIAPSISADGRYVVFSSEAANIVPGDTNGAWDVFVRDTLSGTTECVSISIDGTPGNGDSYFSSVSADGRYVAFESFASDLAADGNGGILVRDLVEGTTRSIGNGFRACISSDGRYVAFHSQGDLVPGDTNGAWDVFVHDMVSEVTELVSMASDGTQGDASSWSPSISADGRYVAFSSNATNLVADDTNASEDVFIHDTQAGTTTRISVASDGTQAGASSSRPSISGDGQVVAFASWAGNLVPSDTNGVCDVFVRNTSSDTTERVSSASDGEEADGLSHYPQMAAGGQYVIFESDATNLVPSDTNGALDVFSHELPAPPGSIIGTVTDGSGAPIENIDVTCYPYSDDSDYQDRGISATTTVDGTYILSGLEPGTYRVKFQDSASALYAPEYFDDATILSPGDATEVVVVSSQATQDIDAVLEEGGRVSGTVTNADGGPLEGIDVEALVLVNSLYNSWHSVGVAISGPDGTYEIAGLATGTYRIGFHDPQGDYSHEYYDDVLDFDSAASVDVQAGATTSGIDAALGLLGHITGTVTDSAGEPISGVHVLALEWIDEWGQWWDNGCWTVTEEDGTYDIGGVRPGTYRVSFREWDTGNYVSEYWDDKPDLDSADDVVIAAGETISGVDAALSPAAHITGTVTDSAGEPISGTLTWVRAYVWDDELESWAELNHALAGEDGTYDLGGLPSGVCKVEFWAAGYAAECWDNRLDLDSADDVAVVTGQVTSGIDAVLGDIDDQTVPVVTDDHVSSYTGEATINITATDVGGSGVEAVYYKVDAATSYTKVTGSVATVKVSSVGSHSLTYCAADKSANMCAPTTITFEIAAPSTDPDPDPDPEPVDLPDGTFEVAGDNRYGTAIEASKRAYPDGAATVVIATGANWPDALGGAALAGVVDGPLLLTPTNSLPDAVLAEVTRLEATDAYILGGTGALTSAVENTLKANLTGNVTRLAGDNRYGTANKVADEVIRLAGTDFEGDAFIATGTNFPDALGASPLAASSGTPILLASKNGTPYIPEEVDSAVILGGTGAVSTVTESAVKTALGAANVARVGGTDRYDTAALVADYGVASGMRWDGVGIATGAAFPDALSGGAMLGSFDSVLLLTRPTSLVPVAEQRLAANKDSIDTVFFIGGTGAVNQSVREKVAQVLQ